MNKEVKFETAKLLKEKQFNEKIKLLYSESGELVYGSLPNSLTNYYSAPTIAEVVMRLCENHDIWIYIQPQSLIGLHKDREADNWYYTIIHCDRVNSNYYGSPTEAYEAAIEYVLKKLI